jgi:hypothetical protein
VIVSAAAGEQHHGCQNERRTSQHEQTDSLELGRIKQTTRWLKENHHKGTKGHEGVVFSLVILRVLCGLL